MLDTIIERSNNEGGNLKRTVQKINIMIKYDLSKFKIT